MSQSQIYLVKDNENLCCHCACREALISFPPQMDCPWCGCGWLFTCMDCRKAFTFARAVAVNHSLEELARRDIEQNWRESPRDEDVAAWVEAMQELLCEVQLGQQYVYLDGLLIPTDVSEVGFVGWHAAHDLDYVPQVAALTDDLVLKNLLANREYWSANAVPDDDDDEDQDGSNGEG